jgi:hypothetical protein
MPWVGHLTLKFEIHWGWNGDGRVRFDIPWGEALDGPPLEDLQAIRSIDRQRKKNDTEMRVMAAFHMAAPAQTRAAQTAIQVRVRCEATTVLGLEA